MSVNLTLNEDPRMGKLKYKNLKMSNSLRGAHHHPHPGANRLYSVGQTLTSRLVRDSSSLIMISQETHYFAKTLIPNNLNWIVVSTCINFTCNITDTTKHFNPRYCGLEALLALLHKNTSSFHSLQTQQTNQTKLNQIKPNHVIGFD